MLVYYACRHHAQMTSKHEYNSIFSFCFLLCCFNLLSTNGLFGFSWATCIYLSINRSKCNDKKISWRFHGILIEWNLIFHQHLIKIIETHFFNNFLFFSERNANNLRNEFSLRQFIMVKMLKKSWVHKIYWKKKVSYLWKSMSNYRIQLWSRACFPFTSDFYDDNYTHKIK